MSHHPSGMPYHIYHNVMGSKPLTDAVGRVQVATSIPANTVFLPARPLPPSSAGTSLTLASPPSTLRLANATSTSQIAQVRLRVSSFPRVSFLYRVSEISGSN